MPAKKSDEQGKDEDKGETVKPKLPLGRETITFGKEPGGGHDMEKAKTMVGCPGHTQRPICRN